MEEPIRILMLFTILNRGGAETMVMNYYRNIDRTKVQFDFMVHRQERGAYDDEIEAMGGRIYRMMPLHPLTFGKYQKQIAAFFDEHLGYKIIHGHCSESGYFVYKEAHKRGIPVIIAHAHSNKALFDGKWLFRTYFKYAMRKYVSHIFTCSIDSAYWLAGKELAHNAILQRNAINTLKYKYSIVKSIQVREALNIPNDYLVIGHIGSFWKLKNQEFLIDIFKEFIKENPKSKLILVGEGKLKEYLIRKVKNINLQGSIIFLGSRNDIPDLLNAFDIFILPSMGEGFSIVTLEAQCNGLSCLVSDVLPNEVILTNLVTKINLNSPIKDWINQIHHITSKTYDRSIYSSMIAQAGYDIHRNAEWLQNYYLEQWQKH